uniref:Uncharacterized protein n=1 Tax=Amphimedon queenslandica TaxID=400682 RepID=A0A1X7SL30_AMPQE
FSPHIYLRIVVIAVTGFNAFFALKMWRTKKRKEKLFLSFEGLKSLTFNY